MNAWASELFLVRRRSATYVIGALWALLIFAFAYLVPYIVYLTLDAPASDRTEILNQLLPPAVGTNSLGSYPMFGGAVMLIFGVLSTGSEYRWNTWKSRLTQGPGRVATVVAKVGSNILVVTVITAVALLVAVTLSLAVAAREGRPLTLPPFSDLLASLAAAALISGAWVTLGAALGVVLRGTSVALAVGLMWTLAFENVVSGLATVWPVLAPIRYVLIGPASGSLVASLGGPSLAEGGAPGVVDAMSGPVAVLVLFAYIIVASLVAAVVLKRRDIS